MRKTNANSDDGANTPTVSLWTDLGFVPATEAEGALWRSHDWWRDRTLWDDFLVRATASPAKLAIVDSSCDDDRGRLTLQQLRAQAEQCAVLLSDLGCQPGDVVACQAPNWWEFLPLALACSRSNLVLCPIAPIYRQRELSFILGRTRARVCVVPHEFRKVDHVSLVDEIRADLPDLDHVLVLRAKSGVSLSPPFLDYAAAVELAGDDRPLAPAVAAGDDVALLMFSSGTTGEPKGVIHTHNTVAAGARGIPEALDLNEADTVLMASTFGHLTGYVAGVVIPMTTGMTSVLMDVWDPHRMLDLVDAEAVCWTMGATPFVLDCLDAQRQAPRRLDSFRHFVTAGSAIPPHIVQETAAELNAELTAVWGMTEVSTGTITAKGADVSVVSNSDGQPVPWLELSVVDDEREQLPPRTPGRLLVRGACVCRGYFQRRDLFDENRDSEGWFDTGDLAALREDGGIRITGRTKDLIVRGGENIPVADVEACLYRHPAIQEVAVVAYPDPRLGERACAVVVAASGLEVSLEDLRAHLREQGLAKQFWPERLVVVSQLPKTPSGKVQKATLREQMQP